ncbi:hypothetical protein ABT112_26805 [Streptomyces sp. NPDC002055]|uniref:hypothetical protein n=1 Tax=Streptomyces sp. NPDC002055 TaxID=3154534 RepID=UPI00332FCDB7
MMRLPSSHAAITAPLVASSTRFPGIPIGRSLLDGRPFHLSPVMADAAILPSTNTLALGGLGSGKSTTAKARAHREHREYGDQFVVIDAAENGAAGEWSPVTHAVGGRVIQAGNFTLNPCSDLFPPAVREQLVRSLILAVEVAALTPQATHALQHALNHPKAASLNGLVEALVFPQDGRWPAAKLAEWGEGAAIALSRYTEGSLRGIFDGQDASLPPTDLPIISFDFTGLDRNSPAIPSLMAAVTCWVEHVWLPQAPAAHRHLVLEEAWQVLLSPATAALIQRQLKNSRRAALSLDVVMHTLSDLGTGRAQDLARLCEIAHVGRLGPEEAAVVGAVLGLPQWATDAIPTLGPGQAVWKVGPGHVDIIQTVLTEEEAKLTDTSSRRRTAQQALAHGLAVEQETEDGATQVDETDGQDDHGRDDEQPASVEQELDNTAHGDGGDGGAGWGWEMPPNVIEVDTRHQDVLQAARAGRFSEAADLAALGERQDITAHGINSDQAVKWLETRAQVAELRGDQNQAAQLRATVTRMGKDVEWFEKTADTAEPQWYSGHEQPAPAAPEDTTPEGPVPEPTRRRAWPYVATIAALAIAAGGVWQTADTEQHQEERKTKAAAYKGRSGTGLRMDGVDVDLVAHWNGDRDRVIVELRSYADRNARYLRIDADGEKAHATRGNDLWVARAPEIALPVTDPLADVTVQIAVGGRTWKKGTHAPSRTIRLSPTGVAYDAETGKPLPSDL